MPIKATLTKATISEAPLVNCLVELEDGRVLMVKGNGYAYYINNGRLRTYGTSWKHQPHKLFQGTITLENATTLTTTEEPNED